MRARSGRTRARTRMFISKQHAKEMLGNSLRGGRTSDGAIRLTILHTDQKECLDAFQNACD